MPHSFPLSRPFLRSDLFLLFQIYFASRTHSQLSQFVSELRKTSFSRSSPSSSSPSSQSQRPIRIIPLGSRQNLCINDDVRKKAKGSNEALGDLCTDLQKGGIEGKRCPYLPPMSEPTKLNDFRDKALVRSFSLSPSN